MDKNLRPRIPGARNHLARALVCGAMLAMLPPLLAQTPPAQTFADIRKRAAEARDADHLDEAIALYRQGLKLNPSWDEGTWYLGTSLFNLKRYAEARDAFRRLTTSQPANAAAWGLRGLCEYELQEYPQAIESFRKSKAHGFASDPELAHLSRFRYALLLNRAGDSEQALSEIIPVALQQTHPEVTQALGIIALNAALLPSEIAPQDRDLFMKAGQAMRAYITHDTENAARLFEELTTAYPDRPNVHYARAVLVLLESDPDNAVIEFEQELKINPSHPYATLQLAILHLKLGDPGKALIYAQKAVDAMPEDATARGVLGKALLESGQTIEAVRELETAVRLAPDLPDNHFVLAKALRKQGKTALATKEMAEFERLDKKHKSQMYQPQ